MSDHTIAGYAAEALASLTPSQLEFLQKLPKAELHAHLNGSIPFPALQQLANEFHAQSGADALPDAVRAGLDRLQHGVVLDEIQDFFGLFPAIYEITSTPAVLRRATRSVLDFFLAQGKDGYAQAAYLELRSTPRETPAMTRRQYIEAVLDELEQYPPERAALIVSLDRRMDYSTAAECIECAVSLKEGRRVVGVDLCGDPTVGGVSPKPCLHADGDEFFPVQAGNMDEFAEHFRAAKAAGLGVTLHIAEVRLPTLLAYSYMRST